MVRMIPLRMCGLMSLNKSRADGHHEFQALLSRVP